MSVVSSVSESVTFSDTHSRAPFPLGKWGFLELSGLLVSVAPSVRHVVKLYKTISSQTCYFPQGNVHIALFMTLQAVHTYNK